MSTVSTSRNGMRFFAPAKTPRAIVDKLNKALNQVLSDQGDYQTHRGARCRGRYEYTGTARQPGIERGDQVETGCRCGKSLGPTRHQDAPRRGRRRQGQERLVDSHVELDPRVVTAPMTERLSAHVASNASQREVDCLLQVRAGHLTRAGAARRRPFNPPPSAPR